MGPTKMLGPQSMSMDDSMNQIKIQPVVCLHLGYQTENLLFQDLLIVGVI